MTQEEMLNEIWTRIMLETIDMDQDTKYLIRGVIQSVLYDVRKAHENDNQD